MRKHHNENDRKGAAMKNKLFMRVIAIVLALMFVISGLGIAITSFFH